MTTTRGAGRRNRQRGQGMTEYVIIVALIAIGTIAIITLFGNNIRALFGVSSNALVGDTSTDVQGMGGKTVSPDSVKRTLSDFQKPEP